MLGGNEEINRFVVEVLDPDITKVIALRLRNGGGDVVSILNSKILVDFNSGISCQDLLDIGGVKAVILLTENDGHFPKYPVQTYT